METNRTKIFTYIGFAKRSKKLTLGVNSVALLKGRAYLLIVCSTATDNTKKDALSLAARFKCPLIESIKYPLEQLMLKENCKLAAVCDDSLAKAIIDNIDGDFKVLSGGIKG